MKCTTPPRSTRRYRLGRPLAVLVAALAVAAFLIPAGGAAAGTRTLAAPTPSCGPVAYKADGTQWQCTFADDFDGSTLDRTKWVVQTTAASNFHSGAECFVDNPQNVAVGGGTLNLTVRRVAPFYCAGSTGGYWTQYTSGTVNTFGKFAQTYGRFEVRAQLPPATVQGLQETLWLWPVNQFKYGPWPASGEIDFGEFYSQYAGWNIPYVHYGVLQSTVSWLTNTNVFTALPAPYNQPGMNCRIDQRGFNTYTLTWSPGRLVIQVNGADCLVDNYSALGLAGAAPFDQPFFLALTQALGVGANAPTSATPLPATTRVDYVRVWK